MVAQRVETAAEVTSDFHFCILGRFLIEKPINFTAMKYTLASIWEPGRGINVMEVGGGRYLFQFFHEVDVMVVLKKLVLDF